MVILRQIWKFRGLCNQLEAEAELVHPDWLTKLFYEGGQYNVPPLGRAKNKVKVMYLPHVPTPTHATETRPKKHLFTAFSTFSTYQHGYGSQCFCFRCPVIPTRRIHPSERSELPGCGMLLSGHGAKQSRV